MKRLALVCAVLAGAVFAEGGDMDLNPDWEFVADTVMGGVSTGEVTQETVDRRTATRLTGQVSLDNDGGFIQMAADLPDDASPGDFDGLRLSLRGNGAVYELRLRTTTLTRPWQSFRAEVTAPDTWTTLYLTWSDFTPHRTDAAFDASELRRIGILAVGREMAADVAVSDLALYHEAAR